METNEVVRHYEHLSQEYYAKSNKYCEQRFSQIIRQEVTKAKRVLELGCGSGFMARAIKQEYIGVDISQRMLVQNPIAIKKNDSLICSDAANLPFSNESFDAVFSINLLEHTPQPEIVIKEAVRVLRKGGNIVMITPNGNIGWILEIAEMLRLKMPEGPHRFLKRWELNKYMRRYDLEVLEFRSIVNFPFGSYGISNRLQLLERLNFGLFYLVKAAKK